MINLNITSFGYILIFIFLLLVKAFIDVVKEDNNKWWK